MAMTCRADRTPIVPPGGHEFHVADMTATFAVDLTLTQAQTSLGEHDQWLPLDGDPARPMGELIDINSTGPLRLGYGGWRDLLLGVQFTDGSGKLITAGGRTLKNVAGYDLTKFMVGAHGVFGRLVSLTARTYRRPAGAVVVTCDSPDGLSVTDLLPTPLRPQWGIVRSDSLTLGYLGDAPFLDLIASSANTLGPASVARMDLDQQQAIRRSLWEPQPLAGESGWLRFRGNVAPARAVATGRALPGAVRWSADAAFGGIVGYTRPADRDAVETAIRAAGGSVGFAVPPAHPTLGPVADPGVRELVLRLKQQFDPQHRLTPAEAIL